MKVDVAMFDCDGTVVDSLNAAYRAEVEAIVTYGGNPPTFEQFKNISLSEGVTWESIYRDYGVRDIPNALDLFYNLYHNAKFEMIPGAAEILEAAKSKGLPTPLVSHDKNREGIIKRLKSSGAYEFFTEEEINCATDRKTPVILAQCKRLGIHPSRVLFTGDSVKDVVDSNTAGCMSAAIVNKYSFNTYESIRVAKPLHILGRIGLLEGLLG